MNKYEVLGVVGEGAFGVVLKCKNKETNEIRTTLHANQLNYLRSLLVAIKKFKEPEGEETTRRTTLREVKILRMLKHENIVELKEAFKRKERLHLVFEYVERNLLEVIEEKPKGLDPETIRRTIYQICRALDYLHRSNIIHRDIKPENLLINRDGSLKLCDFGFARVVPEGCRDLTDYVATRWYRPPELLLSSTSYTKAVDMWAVGCIMGELTDGQPLFPGANDFDQLCVTQKMLGAITPEQMKMFLTHPRMRGVTLTDVKNPETLDRHYKGKMSALALDFMKAILKMDPKQRLTAEQALRHPYFEGLESVFGTNKEVDGNINLLGDSRLDSAKTLNIDGIQRKESASQQGLDEAEFSAKPQPQKKLPGNIQPVKLRVASNERGLEITQKPKISRKDVKSVETSLHRDSLKEDPENRNSKNLFYTKYDPKKLHSEYSSSQFGFSRNTSETTMADGAQPKVGNLGNQKYNYAHPTYNYNIENYRKDGGAPGQQIPTYASDHMGDHHNYYVGQNRKTENSYAPAPISKKFQVLQAQNINARKQGITAVKDSFQIAQMVYGSSIKKGDKRNISNFENQLVVGSKIKFNGKGSTKFLLGEDENRETKLESGIESAPQSSTHLPYLNHRHMEARSKTKPSRPVEGESNLHNASYKFKNVPQKKFGFHPEGGDDPINQHTKLQHNTLNVGASPTVWESQKNKRK